MWKVWWEKLAEQGWEAVPVTLWEREMRELSQTQGKKWNSKGLGRGVKKTLVIQARNWSPIPNIFKEFFYKNKWKFKKTQDV